MEKIYCDACFFIALIQGEEDRAGKCEALLEQAEEGEKKVVVSSWTLAEVAKTNYDDRSETDKSKDEKIQKYFENEYIQVIHLDRVIAERSREFTRNYGLKPSDSVHIATAMFSETETLYTYDGDLLDLNDDFNVTIKEPHWPKGQIPLNLD